MLSPSSRHGTAGDCLGRPYSSSCAQPASHRIRSRWSLIRSRSLSSTSRFLYPIDNPPHWIRTEPFVPFCSVVFMSGFELLQEPQEPCRPQILRHGAQSRDPDFLTVSPQVRSSQPFFFAQPGQEVEASNPLLVPQCAGPAQMYVVRGREHIHGPAIRTRVVRGIVRGEAPCRAWFSALDLLLSYLHALMSMLEEVLHVSPVRAPPECRPRTAAWWDRRPSPCRCAPCHSPARSSPGTRCGEPSRDAHPNHQPGPPQCPWAHRRGCSRHSRRRCPTALTRPPPSRSGSPGA